MKLHFLGANRQVTGSRYLLEVGDYRLGIDCGMFQERAFLDRNWAPSPVDPATIDTMLLTHAHLDHCGLLPKLTREGFRGQILTTPPSIDLARLVLEDSARIQTEDAEYKRKRHKREGRTGPHPVEPLYTTRDAQATLKKLRPVQYGKTVKLSNDITVCYHDAGHILGSALLEITARENGDEKRLLFSGDVGQWDSPLMQDPTIVEQADYVVMESTYGATDQETGRDMLADVAQLINDAVDRGGNLVVPTFAIDRAQDLLYYISQLVADGRIPRIGVSLDSPMAISATTIYKKYGNLLDDETKALLQRGVHPFQFPGLRMARTSKQSKQINNRKGAQLIMAGAGMCTGGRIKHHLRRNIERDDSTILFVGYQAPGTLGRQIVEGAKKIRIHGRYYDVNATIGRLDGLSAHADRRGLLRWLGGLTTPPRRVFLTHGEESVSEGLAAEIQRDMGWTATVPGYGDTIELA